MGTSSWDWKHALKRKADNRYRTLFALLLVGACYIAYTGLRGGTSVHNASRRLLAKDDEEGSSPLDDYPHSYFTGHKGNTVLYFIGMMYMFLALAIVCDEFFVPSLEKITKSLKIKDDVAGATFMAAGGSAPELATSLIGVFTNSNVGFGTIVGSAVFNVLFVIGMCSLFSKEVLTLTWWPLSRDVTFYSIALGCLAWVFSDEKVKIWEACILIGIYISYVSFMAFNEQAYGWVSKKLRSIGIIKAEEAEEDKIINTAGGGFVKARALWKVSIFSAMAHAEKQKAIIEKQSGRALFDQVGKAVLLKHRLQKMKDEARGPEEKAHPFSMASIAKLMSDKKATDGQGPSGRRLEHNISFQANFVEHAIHPEQRGRHAHSFKETDDPPMEEEEVQHTERAHNNWSGDRPQEDQPEAEKPAAPEEDNENEDEDEDDEPLDLSYPDGLFPRLFYLISFPLLLLLVLTIPDPRRPKYEKYFFVAFLLSICWIGIFSYLMVWWATVIGVMLGIPDIVMGLTFLAAGTSVPDLLTSVIVARQGQGDMAVSSSIGSNLFDVCVGLPFPWFLYSVIKQESVTVQSDSLLLSVLILFAMLIAVIVTIALSKWRMTKTMGFIMFGLYALFLLQALLVEFLDLDIGI